LLVSQPPPPPPPPPGPPQFQATKRRLDAADHVTGDAVVLMDANLQEAPEAVSKLWRFTWVRRRRRGFGRNGRGFVLRTLFYHLFDRVNARSPLAASPDAGDVCLMVRRVVESVKLRRRASLICRGLRTWVRFARSGFRSARGRSPANRNTLPPAVSSWPSPASSPSR